MKPEVGIFPAVGSGLSSMAATGQLDRLYAHLGAYAEAFGLRYYTYLPYGDEEPKWDPFYRSTSAILLGPPAPGIREAFLWPWREPARFRSLDVSRVMSLRGVPPALTAYWRWRIPFVVSFGNDYEGIARLHHRPAWKVRWLRRLAERYAAAIFVNNGPRAARMRASNPRVHWVPSWVDLGQFSPKAPPCLARSKRLRLLYVGRLVVEKNLVPVARIAQELQLEFVCVGTGPEEGALRAAGAQCVGVVPWPELPGWYTSADAFILPSFLEGHPKALLEAKACEVPCLISNALDGCYDLPGIRFDPERADSIRNALACVQRGGWRPARWALSGYERASVLAREVGLVAGLCSRA